MQRRRSPALEYVTYGVEHDEALHKLPVGRERGDGAVEGEEEQRARGGEGEGEAEEEPDGGERRVAGGEDLEILKATQGQPYGPWGLVTSISDLHLSYGRQPLYSGVRNRDPGAIALIIITPRRPFSAPGWILNLAFATSQLSKVTKGPELNARRLRHHSTAHRALNAANHV